MKRSALHLLAAATLCVAAASCSGSADRRAGADTAESSDTLLMVTGSYNTPDTEGVELWAFDTATGKSKRLAGLSGISNPSYLAVSADGSRIYSVGEDEGPESTVNTIAFNRDSLTLKLIGTAVTGGGAPCHVNIARSADGRDTHVITANYYGGSFTVYSLDSAGVTTGEPMIVKFSGRGADPERQNQPHAHFTAFTPDATRLLVTDLGTDRLNVYPVTGGAALIDTVAATAIHLAPGAGPRHLEFNPARPSVLYLLDELDGNINVIDIDSMSVAQVIRADSVGAQGSADIHVSPDGRFVYASNRLKADGIAVFAVNPANGLLDYAGYQPTGTHPRNFAITPDGRFLLAACRDDNVIQVYRIDPSTGLLTAVPAADIATPRPVCVRFLPQ